MVVYSDLQQRRSAAGLPEANLEFLHKNGPYAGAAGLGGNVESNDSTHIALTPPGVAENESHGFS